MPVGDDVVDLDDPEAREGAQHPRFDARVFTPGEQRWLRGAAEPPVARFTLWAAKEAAYKLLRQLAPEAIFSPPRFVVQPLGAATLRVLHDGESVHVHVQRSGACLHAVASLTGDGGDLVSAAAPFRDLAHGDVNDPSALARQLALTTLAPRLGGSAALLRIVAHDRIPFLYRGEQRTDVALSLSHHGRFVAFAASLTSAPSQPQLP